jgi:cation efflux family protein
MLPRGADTTAPPRPPSRSDQNAAAPDSERASCFWPFYVTYDAVETFRYKRAPEHSTIGIILAALSLAVMPALVHFKRRIASRLGSGALEAEARQTRVCAYLSAILLAGLPQRMARLVVG